MAGVGSKYWKCEGHFFPQATLDEGKLARHAEIMKKFDFRKNDVFVVTFPKSGTSWMALSLRELYQGNWGMSKIGDGEENELMFDMMLSPDAETKVFDGKLEDLRQDFIKNASSYPSPRLFRSHLPSRIFPVQLVHENGGKIIYVSRNPKDACNSFYHFAKSFLHGEFEESWEKMVEYNFLAGEVPFGPWFDHVTDWYQHGLDLNVLHVTYEEMKTSYKETLKKVADFIQRPVTDQDLQRTVDKCTFQNMVADKTRVKKLPFDDKSQSQGASQYFRKGVIGDWKNQFTVAQSELYDRQLGPKLTECGIQFIYQAHD
ncbi:amine sulfotransferase-like [Glandiceps talaboti]